MAPGPPPRNSSKSAAKGLKERIIGVILTGADSDGENGVRLVKEMGGMVIAQDEETSEVFGVPAAAIQTGAVDFILPLHQIAPKLISLVGG